MRGRTCDKPRSTIISILTLFKVRREDWFLGSGEPKEISCSVTRRGMTFQSGELDLDRPNRQQNYKAVSQTWEKVAAHNIEHKTVKTLHCGLVCFSGGRG